MKTLALVALNAVLFLLLQLVYPASASQATLLLTDVGAAPVPTAFRQAFFMLALVAVGASFPMAIGLSMAGIRYAPKRHGLLAPTVIGLGVWTLVQGRLGRSAAPGWLVASTILLAIVAVAFVPRARKTALELKYIALDRLPLWLALVAGIQCFLLVYGRRIFLDLPSYDDVFRAQFVVQWLSFKPFVNFLNHGGTELRYYSLLELITAFHARVLGQDYKAVYFLGLPLVLHFFAGVTINWFAQELTRRKVPLWFAMATPLLLMSLAATYTLLLGHLFLRQSFAGFLLVVVSLGVFSRFARTRRALDGAVFLIATCLLIGIKAPVGLMVPVVCAPLAMFVRLPWKQRALMASLTLVIPIGFYRWFVKIVTPTTMELAPLRSTIRYALHQRDLLPTLAFEQLAPLSETARAAVGELLCLHVVLLVVIVEIVAALRRPRQTLFRARLPALLAATMLAFIATFWLVSVRENTGAAETYWGMCAQFIGAMLTVLWFARHAIRPSTEWVRTAVLAAAVWCAALGWLGSDARFRADVLWCPFDAPLMRSLHQLKQLSPPKAVVFHNIYGLAEENFVTALSERRQLFSFAYGGGYLPASERERRKAEVDEWWAELLAQGLTRNLPKVSSRSVRPWLLVRGATVPLRGKYKLVASDPPYQIWEPIR